MQTSAIKSSWVAIAPHHRIDPPFWHAITQTAMPALRIDPQTANTGDVALAIAWLQLRAAGDRCVAQEKRQQAAILLDEARTLERGLLGLA